MPDIATRLRRACARPGAPSSDFDLNRGVRAPASRPLTPAAVLIAVQSDTEEVILTKRSARLKDHPGQVAFPGGKLDKADPDAVAAALREAEEEVGLSPEIVSVLGEMPPHETVTAFSVTPILAVVHRPFEPTPEQGEVAEIFRVPLAHLTRPDSFTVQSRLWQGQRRYYYAAPYGPYYIWGATARILAALADRMKHDPDH